MEKENIILSEVHQKFFYDLGQKIKLTRRQKKFKLKDMEESTSISRPTLWKIEKGYSSVAIGSYVRVLNVLGLKLHLMNFNFEERIKKQPRDNRIKMHEKSLC